MRADGAQQGREDLTIHRVEHVGNAEKNYDRGQGQLVRR